MTDDEGMVNGRPDYVTCIITEGNRFKSLCGRDVGFAFTSLEHADLNEKNGGRLVACEDCLKIARKVG
jgi:hypothetical protein